MMLVRASRLEDIDSLIALSKTAGAGMTSMPADYATWEEKLVNSCASFDTSSDKKSGQIYFFVLENTDTHELVGTSAVAAGVGYPNPFYTYKLSTLVSFSKELNFSTRMQVLNLTNDYTDATEVCSLYVLPKFRKHANGKLLSKARYLLFADYPTRFNELVIAELRGWQNEKGDSPFWDHIGSRFYGMDFSTADHLCTIKGSTFITELAPKHPLYGDLSSGIFLKEVRLALQELTEIMAIGSVYDFQLP